MTNKKTLPPAFDEISGSITDDLQSLDLTDKRLLVELAADGRLRAPSQAAREILRDRLRHAEVLPTGPGWAVCRSLEPVSPNVEPMAREVVAAGNISESGISLIDFIGFLANGYQTGVLTASTGDVERSIYFFNGDVVWATSQAPEDRLGEFLLRRGKITRDQLQVAIRDGEMKIGRACVERGFIAAHELWGMVKAQLTEVFDKLLAAKVGLWTFSRISPEILAESQIHMSTQGLLVDALRRLDEMQLYRQSIRSADVVVQRVRSRLQTGEVAPETQDLVANLDSHVRDASMQLLNQLPGTASVHELMRILGRGEFDITRVVYHLLKANLVELVQVPETGPIPRRASSVSNAEAREVISIYSMAIREMFDEMARAGKGDTLRSAVADYLRDESGQYSNLLRGITFQPEGSLEEQSVLTAIQSTGVTSQELSDALSEVLFFILFQATEVLGRRRGDDLARRVKLIHGMLAGTRGSTPGEGT